MHGYGSGLTAFYTSLIMFHPSRLVALARLLPMAVRDFFGHDSLRTGSLPSEFPVHLLAANRRGLILGPARYLQGRVRARKAGLRSPKLLTQEDQS